MAQESLPITIPLSLRIDIKVGVETVDMAQAQAHAKGQASGVSSDGSTSTDKAAPLYGQSYKLVPVIPMFPEAFKVESILFKIVEIPFSAFNDDAAICRGAVNGLEKERNTAHVDRSGAKISCGNAGGLSLLDDLRMSNERSRELLNAVEKLKGDCKSMKDDFDAKFKSQKEDFDAKFEAQNTKLETVNQQLQDQRIIGKAALKGRNRFLAQFLQEKMNSWFDEEEKKIILDGHIAVHHGDPLMDAMIFKEQIRTTKTWMYEDLYGLAWQQVLDISRLHKLPEWQ